MEPIKPTLALFGSLGTTEILLILLVILIIFGGTKLPQLGAGLGKAIKNFKSAMKEGEKDEGQEQKENTGEKEKRE